jgi:hypothetical protein
MEIKECLDYLSSSKGREDLTDFVAKGLVKMDLPETLDELRENDELRQTLIEDGIQIGFREDVSYATIIGYDKYDKAVILDLSYVSGENDMYIIELSKLYLSELLEIALAL